MLTEGAICSLRSVESSDVDTILLWENDPKLWSVSETDSGYTRAQIEKFVYIQSLDAVALTGQLRLMIVENGTGRAVGCIDLFDCDEDALSAGVGILVYDDADRHKGYATEALQLLELHARITLGLHELHAQTATSNEPCRRLFTAASYAVTVDSERGMIHFCKEI